MFNKAYIFGLGMIGGSIAYSLKKNKIAKYIYAFDKDKKSLLFAKREKIINDFDRDFNYLKESDLIIICTPINAYKSIFETIKSSKNNKCLITDVGSTKKTIMQLAAKVFGPNQTQFVGSHPLAGKEKSGVKNSSKNLFKDAVTIITGSKSIKKSTINKIKSFWKKIGCKTEVLTPDFHDVIMSQTSHIPHLISYGLVNSIYQSKKVKNIGRFTGGGFEDFARIARSNPVMWRDICQNNRRNILSSLDSFIKELKSLKLTIKRNDYKLLYSLFKKTRNKLL
ncbi:MAG: prephenate dehydrogenase/arogenate dehydrogenase family protein [Pseudomonadota bacterium]|nr:prephenate dehydrogenase/arogenate dehydrogenase family protein [Pseudomonadota bacterium]